MGNISKFSIYYLIFFQLVNVACELREVLCSSLKCLKKGFLFKTFELILPFVKALIILTGVTNFKETLTKAIAR